MLFIELIEEWGVQKRKAYWWLEKAAGVFPELDKRRKVAGRYNPLEITLEEEVWLRQRVLGNIPRICTKCGASYRHIRGESKGTCSKTLCPMCWGELRRIESRELFTVRYALVSENDLDSCYNLIGCTSWGFQAYMRETTPPEIYNSRKGKTHIDHYIPRSFFNQEDPIEKRICWHYLNTRLVWKDENFIKGKALPPDTLDRINEICDALHIHVPQSVLDRLKSHFPLDKPQIM